MSEPVRKAPRWAWWVATGLGSGRLRPAPGTWGSLAALAAWCLFTFAVTAPFLAWVSAQSGRAVWGAAMEALFLLVIALMAWLSVRASDRVVEETGQEDPGFIVADEWVGMWIALWPLRWTAAQEVHRFLAPGGWRWALLLAAAFLAFRLFDIWKPWPIRQIQDLPGGQGIVADDLVAGLYALPLVTLFAAWATR